MESTLFSLDAKVILITGGYGYLGSSITKGLYEVGAIVYVLGRNQKKFKESFPNIESRVFFQTCDISDTESIKSAFANIHKKHNKIDVLINNAFYSKGQDPEAISDEDWAFSVDGSLNSVYRCIREIIPYMKDEGGKIINVSSMYGIVSPNFELYKESPQYLNPPHYGAAKAGVLQLTRYFASYLGKYGINVNSVTPGPFPNKEVQKNEMFIHRLKEKNPLNRIGTPDDLKGAFVFLSSNASNFVNAHNLVVDGGWTTW